jgi:sigma-B regulation protein RsbU (phosphoserine phosphatase)
MDPGASRPADSVELVSEIQRELSRLTNPADLVRTFVASLARVLPISRIMYLLPWPPPVRRYDWIPGPDVPVGSLGYRILLDVDLRDPAWPDRTDFRTLFTPRTGFEPDATGGLLADIIAQHHPIVRDDLSLLASEPGLGPRAATHRSMVAVPIYWQGHTQAWIVVFADAPGAFRDDDVRLLLSTGNMLARSAVYLDTLEEATRANARLRATFAEIGRVQRLLLPASLPDDPRLAFATSYMTSDAAGGDYYDVYAHDPHTLDLVIADVSGHGPVASVAMAMLRTAMQSWCRNGRSPASVVPDLNDLMHTSLDEGMFITACFLHLDRRTGSIHYVNCGHNPPIVRRRVGGFDFLDVGGGPPLGVCADLNPTPASITLRLGDLLLLYTDGITEAFNPRHEQFGLPRFLAAIEQGQGDPIRTKHTVQQALDLHAAGMPRQDDQTLVAMGYRTA